MTINKDPKNLEQLLELIRDTDHNGKEIKFGDILDQVGHRSFGSLLLTAGLIISAPLIGDIPGVPVLLGAFVILTSGQLLLGKDHFWLPKWLLERSADPAKLDKGMDWIQPVARFIDRWLKPRLKIVTGKLGIYAIAIACVLVGLLTPVMEFIPFSAQFAGAAITAFGLAIIAKDGLFAILGYLITAGIFGLLIYGILL